MTIQEMIDLLHMENTPAGGRLLVLELVKATTSEIILAEDNREAPEPGIVLRIGLDGVGPESGRTVPIASKVGDVVWYGRYAGLRTAVEGPEREGGRRQMVPVLLMQDSEVLMRRDTPETYELIMHDDDPKKVHRVGLICEHCTPVKPNLEALQAAAYGPRDGDVIDAEVDDPEPPKALPEGDYEARKRFMEEERARIRAEQRGGEVELAPPDRVEQ